MDGLADFHPAIRTWFERRFGGPPTPSATAGRRSARPRHPDLRPHRLRQDSRRLPRQHRPALIQQAERPNPTARRGAGRLRLAPQGPWQRHPAQPRGPLEGIAEVAREMGLPDHRHPYRSPHRRHHSRRRASDRQAPAAHPHHDPRVPLPHGHRREEPRDPPQRQHRHRRRDPRPHPRQARQSTSPSPSPASTTSPTSAHPASASRPPSSRSQTPPASSSARRGRSRPDGEPDCAIVNSGHQRDLELTIEVPPTRDAGRRLRRPVEGRLRSPRRAHQGAPHHPRLRQHPPPLREGRPSPSPNASAKSTSGSTTAASPRSAALGSNAASRPAR